ncbi:hypothetical protein G4H71_12805 [Rhodococcus triatomae]|uniref:Transmembrane protein n=1 Tax=Rhodococcus triatomae TaxID=300028 RepID=A0A1G8GTR6_9NOCA|nr:hypothetical protein [Rhodococcus triatomae]QNG20301.1 hypothetical protein G4H72_17575 [Rhodococcus triatomae]QNG23784.1 hypothetical protein G4H71_12805 [Rhodococcus triatomae]SDH97777.1 hypothetical protein SAMN05444695_104201 [Rhodococcus triatomae]
MTVRAHRAHTSAPWVRLVPWIHSLVLTVLVLGPLFGPGYLLLRDAVSTPRSYLTDTALGLTGAAARAVPQDVALAFASSVLDGGIVVKVLLLGALTAAGAGAAAMVRTLLPTARLGAQLLAATVTLWNPYVAERLLQGHWSLLVGYAALPWAVCAAVAVRRRRRGGWWALGATLAVAGLTPTGVVLVAVAVAVVLAAPGGGPVLRRLTGLLGLFLVASAPWLTATVVAGGEGTSDPGGVAAFAARAEPGLATIGSLAGLGGIWNSQAVPGTRTTLFAVVGTVALLAIVACGVPALWRRRRNPVTSALALLAVAAVALPALAATPWGLEAGGWIVETVPGAGLLRDAQKWVALAVPGYACAAAAAVLPRRRGPLSTPEGSITAAAGAILLVVVSLPDLAWGVGGALRPVPYSPEWREVTQAVSEDPGDVAVLPPGMFRIVGGAPALDPAPRLLPADVLQSGELVVGGEAVSGEGTRAAEAERTLLAGGAPEELAALGVRWVLVEHPAEADPGDFGAAADTLDRLAPVVTGEELSLYRVPGAVVDHAPGSGARAVSLAAHAAWAGLLVVGLAGALATRRRHQPRRTSP